MCIRDRYQRRVHGECHPVEVALPKDLKVVDIACGEEHAALMTSSGEVFTWGYGLDGQLGHSAKANLSAPKKIEKFNEKASKICCGGGHTAILTTNNELYLFGRGRDGQLGKGDMLESVASSHLVPTKVEYFGKEKMKVVDVALGTNHTLSITEEI
eukprot:TRINITY_DN995_c0_g1_i6.p1 TRINITY_DN995_c0_g1~~TRINITY_DN995_c0_g1_i6.p1  ORF type:complete len:171 (-),score=44.80 TRINITY_DN995_c0_g1_i6:34-501(-)